MTFNELASSFDTVGQNYEKFRPNYVPELYREIFASCSLNSTSQVLEIGIGTGQATLPFLATGCQLIAIEPGINLADVCKEKFSNYPNLHLISGKFEDVSLPKESFDLIYSATAFHWITRKFFHYSRRTASFRSFLTIRIRTLKIRNLARNSTGSTISIFISSGKTRKISSAGSQKKMQR